MFRISHIVLAAALVAILSIATLDRALACGAYGPPPMSQTMFAALSGDARVAAPAIEKMRQQGVKALNEVREQQRWLPREVRLLTYQIASFEKLVAGDQSKLSAEQKTKRKLQLTQLKLKRAEAMLRIKQVETLLKRLQWVIARSTVMA